MNDLFLTIGGWVLSAALLWAFIDAKSDVKAEIERCNTTIEAAVRERTEALRSAQIAAYEERIANLEQIAQDEAEARRIATEAARAAESRPERVRTVIREVASEDDCMDRSIDPAVLDSLRS